MEILAYMVDFKREAFVIPFLNISIYWYGILFGLGFLLTANHLKSLILGSKDQSDKEKSKNCEVLMQALSFYSILGIVVGSRLFHVAFYDGLDKLFNWTYLVSIRDGGLASHGGILFVLLAIWLVCYRHRNILKYFELTFSSLLDKVVISSMIIAGFIRIGNFINQEILGKQTDCFLGLTFMNPLGDLAIVKRHPVQVYEAIFYFGFFFILRFLYKRYKHEWSHGTLSSLFFVVLFSFRLFIETFKENQSIYDKGSLQMGQWLSLPFIFFAIWRLYRSYRKQKKIKLSKSL